MCEQCGDLGPRNCANCRSRGWDRPEIAPNCAQLRLGYSGHTFTTRAQFAALALVLCGLIGLVALAVVAIVGPIVGW